MVAGPLSTSPAWVTVKVKFSVDVPATFVAVIVYEVVGDATIGVPEIVPVVGSIERPLGSVGDIEYVAVPPVFVSVTAVNGWVKYNDCDDELLVIDGFTKLPFVAK
jgi:hypothetical protein